ncbi:MAG: aminodeoxychorismate synthase component I [Proteobacteria bacterium]|nr:aminodeoxychorismate synthase component I [Pseudomonadota bacterium]
MDPTIADDLPLSAFNQLDASRYPYLLSSSAIGQNNSRYDILLAFPQFTLTLDADKTLHCTDPGQDLSGGFLTALDKLLQKDRTPVDEVTGHLPFTGGWFVYLSYEMAQEIEPCLSLPSLADSQPSSQPSSQPGSQPLAFAARCPAAIIFDKNNDQYMAVAEAGHAHLLDDMERDFIAIRNGGSGITAGEQKIELQSLTEADAQPYLQQVERIKRYIVDGDIFQANLSRQWQAVLSPDEQGMKPSDAALFDALARYNPSSFAALACLPGMTIISSSPERLVSLKDGIVETRPIAGTRPRHDDQQSDEALAEELLAHPKEQAEHIMLIDLERNDLGRVCRPGSIEVNELMVLESWQHVHHIVSNVRGKLEEGKSPVDVLRAMFPGGTITGCPKVRCIEILAEMEQQARGAYTGSLGYINNDGSMDFNILIRTMVRDSVDGQDRLTFRAGGGIVSDSIAERELEETRAKAKGLLKMFQMKVPDNT